MTALETTLLTAAVGALAKQAADIVSESGKGLFSWLGGKVGQTKL